MTKKKPFDGFECEYCIDFEHVIFAAINVVISQVPEKTGIPEGIVAGLHIFENATYIVSQFSSKPPPIV